MITRVVLALDDGPRREELQGLLARPDVIVESVGKQRRLWERIGRQNADLIVVSRSLIPEPAFDTMQLLQNLPDSPGVVVLSGSDDPSEQAGLLAAGCDVVLHTGLSAREVRDALAVVLEKRREQREHELLARRTLAEPRLTDFVSSSLAMQTFMNVARRVVHTEVSLLILGETGVGKERLARAIHAESVRSKGPFVAVNCGALPEALLESELFGHEEGAFTGASRARRGWFELAHGGTIFLDEIGEMPLHLQVKLLRVLQEHAIQRVGSEKAITVDVRVMAATNRELEEEVGARRFRRDLYYRLGVVTLTIPPLRERREDIPELADSYIDYYSSRIGRSVTGIAPAALEALTGYSWPGNVRELINVIERAMLLCEGEEITLRDLPVSISGVGQGGVPGLVLHPGVETSDAIPQDWLEMPLSEVRRQVVDRFERAYLAGLLEATGGRIGETARRAGMRARSLYDKMKRHGLHKEDFRKKPALP
ncbi:MAG TPA: sigma-54 dependent transcriptional regulator [Planctomycetota bacterium]|nr:sigma-54 dependent transcriptional regulator [Planctomycetota bacterium]